MKLLAGACHQAGMDFGVHDSQPDWHHPDYRNGAAHARYVEYLHGQVRELLTNYGKIAMWFFDGLGGTSADWDAPRLLRTMRRLRPDLVINNRAGLPADYDTPSNASACFRTAAPGRPVPPLARTGPTPDDQLRSLEECLRGLVCCAIGTATSCSTWGRDRMARSNQRTPPVFAKWAPSWRGMAKASLARAGAFVAPD